VIAMAIDATDFLYLCALVKKGSGIILEQGKEYLFDARLSPLLRQEKISSIGDLVLQLRMDAKSRLHQKIVDVMTTNETFFFRDMSLFEGFTNSIVPELIEKRKAERKLNIWCGASSSGQEPYSVAMLLREQFPVLKEWTINFIATDLSGEILDRAREGRYSHFEVNRGLPVKYLLKYFQKSDLNWQVKDDIRKMIEFRKMNLIEPWPVFPKMDVVFMRNVLIYFNTDMKKSILANIRRVLSADGYLYLGGAETTFNLDDAYVRSPLEKTFCYKVK